MKAENSLDQDRPPEEFCFLNSRCRSIPNVSKVFYPGRSDPKNRWIRTRGANQGEIMGFILVLRICPLKYLSFL